MELLIICGCAAWVALLVTRKAGPYGLFVRIRAWGRTFRCSACLSALVGAVTWALLLIPGSERVLLLPAALGYALALMALTGVVDLGDE